MCTLHYSFQLNPQMPVLQLDCFSILQRLLMTKIQLAAAIPPISTPTSHHLLLQVSYVLSAGD